MLVNYMKLYSLFSVNFLYIYAFMLKIILIFNIKCLTFAAS